MKAEPARRRARPWPSGHLAMGRPLGFGLDLQLDEGRQADGQRGAGDGDAVEDAFDGATQVNPVVK